MPMQIGPETGAERRIFPRKEIHARVESKRLDHTIPAHLQPHLSLALRDLSFAASDLQWVLLNKVDFVFNY